MKPIFRTLRYLKFFPKEIAGNVFFNIFAIVFNLFSFVLIIPFVELLFGLTEPPLTQPAFAFNREALTDCLMYFLSLGKARFGIRRCLLVVIGGYLLCVLASNICRYMGLFFLSPIRNGVISRLRRDLYSHIVQLPVSYFKRHDRGDILSRFSNDLADVEWSVVSTLQSLIKDPVNVLLFAGVLIFVSPKLFLLFLLILPVAVWLIAKIGHGLKRDSVEGQNRLGRLFALLDEDLEGVRDIRLMGRETTRHIGFAHTNHRYFKTLVKVARRRELSSPLSEVLGTIGLAAILVIGGTLVFQGEIATSVFIFFVIIFARLIPPVQAVVKAYNSLVKGSASAARIFAVIDAENTVKEDESPIRHPIFESNIELNDVGFAYQNEEYTPVPVLHHINMKIPKGDMVAIVGPSGAGKSTLVDLLPHFYDCTSGSISVDGIPIDKLQLKAWRSHFGIVSQQCVLFNDTIAANIAFAQDTIDSDRIARVAKMACAEEFILQLPDGYNTHIGDQGMMLSGGQRQRLSIARALYSEPDILILDEATSALDAESEALVQEALDKAMEGRTCIVVAHRLSTVKKADQIIVIKQGRIVETGTHFSLIEQGGEYKKMVEMQTLK